MRTVEARTDGGQMGAAGEACSMLYVTHHWFSCMGTMYDALLVDSF